jgi:arylsulfatase A-like enzyme
MPQAPTRREFTKTLGAAAFAAGALAAQQVRRPNVLYIFSDQHRACSMPGEPYNDAEAPNLARLASEGLTFRNCISNYPVCSPYRGILLSGRWPYQTGVIDNAWPLKTSETSLGETFRKAGYRTGYVGKWHLDARGTEGSQLKPEGDERHGFDWWRAWYNTNPHFDTSHTYDLMTGQRETPNGYNATRMTDDAIRFLGRHRGEPWFLVVSWNPPHSPFLDAPKDLMERYDPRGLQLRPNTVETVSRPVGGGKGFDVRRNLRGYNAHITAIDIEMGRILKHLDETGLAANTIVVYTSDHGEMMGAQNRTGKRLPHEESCNVPLIVRYPGAVPAGESSQQIVSTIDLYPTLCGLAGVPVPGHCEGVNLAAAALGKPAQGPEHALLMHVEKAHATGGRNHPAPIFRGIRTARYTYAVGDTGRWCFYDNQEDPYQQHNLASDMTRANLMSDLDGEILDGLEKAEDPYPYQALRPERSITGRSITA